MKVVLLLHVCALLYDIPVDIILVFVYVHYLECVLVYNSTSIHGSRLSS